jgi:hypothetical protein
MPEESSPQPTPFVVRGLHRGAELSGRGSLELGERALTLVVAGSRPSWQRPIVIGYDGLDGARLDGDHLAVFLASGDLFEIAGSPDVVPLARELMARVCSLPELTLRLRGLGSGRANPGSDHDRFFGPLLAARRLLAERRSPRQQVEALAAARVRRMYDRLLTEFAAERFPESPAERRSLEAELDELAEPLMATIDALEAAEQALRTAADDVRFARWRSWAAAVQHTFDEADRLWIAALPALSGERGQRGGGRFWRRVLRLRVLLAAVAP